MNTFKKVVYILLILSLMTSVVSAQSKDSNSEDVRGTQELREREQFLLEKVQELDRKMAKAPLEQRLKARDALLKKYNISLVSREYTIEDDNDVSTQETDKSKLSLVINAYEDELYSRAYYIYGDYDWSSTISYPYDSELGAPNDVISLRIREPENEKLAIEGRALWNYDVHGYSQSNRVSKRFENEIGVIWDLNDYSSVSNNWTDHGTSYMYIIAKIGAGTFQAKTYMDYEHNKGSNSNITVGFKYQALDVSYSINPSVKWQKNVASRELYFN